MRELQNMSYQEISEKLGQNLSTIKSRIRNGRIQLMRNTKQQFDILDVEI